MVHYIFASKFHFLNFVFLILSRTWPTIGGLWLNSNALCAFCDRFSSMISNSLQFWQFCQLSFQLKAGLNLNGLCAHWLEYDLVDIQESDAVITGCYADYKGGLGCWLWKILYIVFSDIAFYRKNRHQNGWEDSIDKNLNSWRMEILIFDISYILLFAPPSAKQMEIRENLKFRFRFPPLERNKTSIHDGQKNIYCFDTFVLQNPQGKISF